MHRPNFVVHRPGAWDRLRYRPFSSLHRTPHSFPCACFFFVYVPPPSRKQVAFLGKYTASFADTEKLDAALGQWEEAAVLINLREHCLGRLKRMEKGEGALGARVREERGTRTRCFDGFW